MKQTPKSCGCFSCRRGKSSKAQKFLMKLNERSFRHASRISLAKGAQVLMPAPYGQYTD